MEELGASALLGDVLGQNEYDSHVKILVSLLGLATLKAKQESKRRATIVENELAKNEALVEALATLYGD